MTLLPELTRDATRMGLARWKVGVSRALLYCAAHQANFCKDPVTGLGTPNYQAMLELYMSMP